MAKESASGNLPDLFTQFIRKATERCFPELFAERQGIFRQTLIKGDGGKYYEGNKGQRFRESDYRSGL